MKTAVLSNFDGDEFSFQYLDLATMNEDTNRIAAHLEYYCNTNASWLDPNAIPNNIIA